MPSGQNVVNETAVLSYPDLATIDLYCGRDAVGDDEPFVDSESLGRK
jgi:hypothetical protein